ncbi:MAG: hypothetical protein QOE97_358 [Pseudonocardiales bacterium]|nr:hypothetical protein [Pseudonocardiales bacterium]
MNNPAAPPAPGPEALTRRSPTRSKATHTPSTTDGRSSRWQEHRAARREELIDAAVEAVRAHGARAGMDQIAAAARTSKPVIYRYFADKNDLYRAISHRVVEQVLGTLAAVIATEPAPSELVQAGVDAYLGLLEDNPGLYRFVAAHPLVGGPGSQQVTDFASAVAGLLAGPLEQHLGEIGLDPALAHPWSESIVGFISAASLWWLDHRAAMTRQQLGDYLTALLWGGAAGVLQSAGQQADPRPARGVFPSRPDRKGRR